MAEGYIVRRGGGTDKLLVTEYGTGAIYEQYIKQGRFEPTTGHQDQDPNWWVLNNSATGQNYFLENVILGQNINIRPSTSANTLTSNIDPGTNRFTYAMGLSKGGLLVSVGWNSLGGTSNFYNTYFYNTIRNQVTASNYAGSMNSGGWQTFALIAGDEHPTNGTFIFTQTNNTVLAKIPYPVGEAFTTYPANQWYPISVVSQMSQNHGQLFAMTSTFNYVTNRREAFMSGASNYNISRYNFTDTSRGAGQSFGYIGSYPNYGGLIYGLHVDNSFVYAVGQTSDIIQRYFKSTYNRAGASADYGGAIYTMAADNERLYVAGTNRIDSSNTRIKTFWKSNLQQITEGPAYVGQIWNCIVDQDNVYYAGTNQTVGVVFANKITLATVGNAGNMNKTIRAMVQDNDFIYAGGADNSSNSAISRIGKRTQTAITAKQIDFEATKREVHI
jgi:hypothetical protein